MATCKKMLYKNVIFQKYLKDYMRLIVQKGQMKSYSNFHEFFLACFQIKNCQFCQYRNVIILC